MKEKQGALRRREKYAPSPIDPTNDVPTKSERAGGVTQPALRALEHSALVDEVVEHFTTLSEKVIQTRIDALQEGVLVERVVFQSSAQHTAAEGVFRRFLGRAV